MNWFNLIKNDDPKHFKDFLFVMSVEYINKYMAAYLASIGVTDAFRVENTYTDDSSYDSSRTNIKSTWKFSSSSEPDVYITFVGSQDSYREYDELVCENFYQVTPEEVKQTVWKKV